MELFRDFSLSREPWYGRRSLRELQEGSVLLSLASLLLQGKNNPLFNF